MAVCVRDQLGPVEDTPGEMRMLDRLGYYARHAGSILLGRDPGLMILGLAVTDRCNLNCASCHVANTGRRDMTYSEAVAVMRSAHDRGARELYFTGGEPTIWRDDARDLNDLISAAREIGFFHVHLYTNGLLGLAWPVDLVWVSIDGLAGVYASRRGDHFAQVEAAVRAPGNPKVAVIYTIDRYTASGIAPFLRWVRSSRLPVTGVMVYFHTPYYGKDELYLDAAERASVVDELLALKRERLPLINSTAGLRALRSGDWPRRSHTAVAADIDGEWFCCRAGDEVCPDCGYGACTEISEAERLRPSAILAMARYL